MGVLQLSEREKTEYVDKNYCQLQHNHTNSALADLKISMKENTEETKRILKLLTGNGSPGIISRCDNNDAAIKTLTKEIHIFINRFNTSKKDMKRTWIELAKIAATLVCSGGFGALVLKVLQVIIS